MNTLSKDNFKDDFERNRQEIKPNQSEPTHKETDQDETSFDVKMNISIFHLETHHDVTVNVI